MQEVQISNSPVVTGICDANKSRAWHHCQLNKYLRVCIDLNL